MDFRLKPTKFFNRAVAIICQNENGPCPLIAIANVLTLKGSITISPDRSFISLEEVIQLVADEIFKSLESRHVSQNEEDHGMKHQTMQDVLNVLPRLSRGLDVNIGFKAVNQHEFTEEISIFDSLGIPLLHGWIYDGSDTSTAEVIGELTYNHLLYKMVDYRTLMESESKTETPENERLHRDGPIIDAFLTHTASQLTFTGLVKLYEFMNDRQLAVFFRNNHFSTLFSYNGQLFLLMTDLGYLRQPAVIWELLDSVDGKSEFYNDEFVPLSSLPFAVQEEPVLSPRTEVTQGTVALPPETPREEPIDPSLLLAMQLQQEEEQSFIQHTAGAAAEPIIQPAAIQFTAPPPAQSTVPPSNLSSSITHLPTALDYIVSPSAVSLAGTTAAMPAGPDPTDHHAVAQQLGLTAEEYDHQIAMVLYWEEKNQKSEESASRRELLSPTVTAPQQPPSPTVAVGNSNSNPQARKQKKATSSSDSSRRENSNPNSSNCTVN